ncbi:MAG TPA: hypothetical protein VGR95_07945 [Thermoanaerobaculia bacterium]|jgi:hypothetical protein|nr:hypothetical protein [Thermoanaerobaculia bacterium]
MKRIIRMLSIVMVVAGIGLTTAAKVAEAAKCCSDNGASCCTGACCWADSSTCTASACPPAV